MELQEIIWAEAEFGDTIAVASVASTTASVVAALLGADYELRVSRGVYSEVEALCAFVDNLGLAKPQLLSARLREKPSEPSTGLADVGARSQVAGGGEASSLRDQIDRLVESRAGLDVAGGEVRVVDRDRAARFATEITKLAQELIDDALARRDQSAIQVDAW